MERRDRARWLASLIALLLAGCPTGKTPPATGRCDPSTPGSCGSTALVCESGACQSCPTGTQNCNGSNLDGCESTTPCIAPPPPECSVTQPDACGTSATYCAQGRCVACPAGHVNCNGESGDGCEQAGQCGVPPPPECEVAQVNACGAPERFCSGGACVDCPAGQKNCDGENANGCEYPGNTPQVLSDTGAISGTTADQGLADHCVVFDPKTYVLKVTTSAPTSLQIALAAHTASAAAVSLRSGCAVDNGCSVGGSTINWTRTVGAGTYHLVVATDVVTGFDIGVAFNSPP